MNNIKIKRSLSVLSSHFSMIVALVAVALLVGCSNEDDNTPSSNSRTPLTVNAGVSTRATDVTWHSNDLIGIYTLVDGTDVVYSNQANYKYINTAGSGATATFDATDKQNTAYYPEDGSKVDVLAYYPYADQSALETGLLKIDVSSQTSLPAIDLMTSERAAGHSTSNINVSLVFRHRLAKLAMVVNTDASTTGIDASAATVTLHGTATKGTYNLLTQEISSTTDVADINLVGGTAIVMPTAAGSGVAFTVSVGGKDFTATLPDDIALQAGKVTTVVITLKQETIADISATIEEWGNGGTATANAINVVTPNNPLTGEPDVKKFTVTKNGLNPTVYEYANGAWTASPKFFLVEETLPTDVFAATAIGVADAITSITDDLATDAVTMSGGAIALEFKHTKAKLTLNLTAGTDFPANINLSNAVVKLLNYTQTVTGSGNSFIMNPSTTLAAGALVGTITLGELTYNVKLTNALELEAGKHATLNITLEPTDVTVTISVAEWTPDTAEAGAAVAIDAVSLSELPGDGVLTLTYGSTTATYSFVKLPTPTLTLTSGTPIYWESIVTRSMGQFMLTFTPNGNGTPEKDILQGTVTPTVYGAPLSFTLGHINSRISVTLKKGALYSDAEWAAITADSKTTVTFAGLSANAYTATYDYTVANNKAGLSTIFTPKTAAELAALSSATATVSIPAVNGTPQVAATSLSIDLKNYFTQLNAGTEYNITLTVDKNKVTVGDITVAQWNEISGSGSMNY
ncbi:fimbrillin family protein [Bacteroides sp. 224]|uniref:fimbrillin family protein n=1 Tax=Bacteroides sp. 224 TaxID=2302936 RepID=UPI0013D75A46|nr:fimbrillin family protein [Bacteroides sp. 224]